MSMRHPRGMAGGAAAGEGAEVRPHLRLRADIVLLVAGVLLLLWLLADVLLLAFTAILLAVALDAMAVPLARLLHIRRGWALLLAGLATLGFLIGAVAVLAPQIAGQIGQIWNIALALIPRLAEWLAEAGWTEDLMARIEGAAQDIVVAAADIVGRLLTFGMSTLGAAATVILALTVAIFFAADPDLYRRGLIRLVPKPSRPILAETLSEVARALRWWFLGQLVSMVLLGVTVGLGLFLIGIELWLSLALLTALLTFVPYLGPYIAAVPILIVAFSSGLDTGLLVFVFYLIVQTVEGNVIVPLIHQKAVELPPALSILAQVLMGLSFGIVGFVLAAPLTVVMMVMVRKLYVDAVLEDTGQEVDAAEAGSIPTDRRAP